MKPVRIAAGMIAVALCTAHAEAQQLNTPYTLECNQQQRIGGDEHRYLCRKNVRIEKEGTTLFADQIEGWDDGENADRVIATGNVVFTQGKNQISADRADFNTKTKTGTFWNASGSASVQPPRQSPFGGGYVAPQISNPDTDVQFFGDIVEKLGPKTYKITRGAFTTCLQPEPRWEFHADSVTLKIDDYTLLRQAIFDVKGVPLLYLPIVYYPTNKDGRATGVLLPSYSSTSLRGPSIRNEFFWAIGRSHDATFTYDWYTKTGQGYGGEYRYNIGSGAGTFSNYWLADNQTTYTTGGTLPEGVSYFLKGNATQSLPHRLRFNAQVDYFSDFNSNQLLSADITNYSQNRRSYDANLTGAWRRYSLSARINRSQYFGSATTSTVEGNSPNVRLIGSDRPLFGTSSLYGSFTSEYAHIDRQTINNDLVIDDRTLHRIDVAPIVRYPIKRWQWFTVNPELSWRDTFYSQSIAPRTNEILEESLNRQVVGLKVDAVGPVFNRVWDTPSSGYAEKFKHSIEPFTTFTRTQSFATDQGVIAIDTTDTIFTDTSVRYGIRNRLYAKQRVGTTSQAREIANASITQTYHDNQQASAVDTTYGSSFTTSQPSHFTPVLLEASGMPTVNATASALAEFDMTYHQFRKLSARFEHRWFAGATSIAWSQQFRVEGLDNYAIPNRGLNFSTQAHTRNNRYGANYSFNLDAVTGTMLQQTYSGFYNAQCCGVAMQYTNPRYSTGAPIPVDHRFFVSVTLAGLGSFSPFSPGLGGIGR
jgi:LPS-assembly protein